MGIANFSGTAISGIFWLYIATLLGPEQYGEISYFLSIAIIASAVSFVGAGSTLTVYTAKEVKIHGAIYFISMIASSVSVLILFLIFYKIGVGLYPLGYVIFGLSVYELLGRKDYNSYSKFMILQRIFMAGFAISLYYVIGADGIILGIALSFFPFSFRLYKIFKESKIDFTAFRSKFGFILNSYALDLSHLFFGNIDKLIIGPLVGFAILGNYHLGLQFYNLLSLLPSVVYQYILPQDASGKSHGKLKKITILISAAIAVLGIVLSPLVIPVLFPKFTEAVEVMQIISIAMVPGTINLMYMSKFLGMEKSKLVLIGTGISLAIQIPSLILLGSHFDVNGLATSIVLAAFGQTAYFFIMNRTVEKRNQ